MPHPENLPPADNLGQIGLEASGTEEGSAAPCWRRVALPADHPVTRINAALLKTGLHCFQAVMFNQRGALTQVSGKRRAA